jgi:DNA polymerase III subunit delta
MATVDSQVIYKELENKKFRSLYFFYGDESYLIDQMPDRFKFAVLDENSYDFNLNLYYADDAQVSQIREAAETLPVFSQHRLLIVKNAHLLNDSDWAELDPVISNPVDSTVLIFIADKVDKRKKFFKVVSENAAVVEFKKPYDNQVPGWINYIAQNHFLKLTPDAIHKLHRLVGNNLSEIDSQIKKLRSFKGAKPGELVTIELFDVNQVVSLSREESIFDFTKAIGQKDRPRALEQLVQLLDQGQNEVSIVQLVARHMRILLTVRTGLDQGLGGAKLASVAKVPAYFIEGYCDQAQHWPVKKIEEALSLLQETDKALKSSPLSSHLWLENMVLKSCDQKSQI